MTKEEKDLLMVDLCRRLHYDVICQMSRDIEFPQGNSIIEVLSISGYEAFVNTMNCSATTPFFVKPYLRPMSSITDDEIKDLQKITCQFCFSRYDNLAYVGAADDGFCSVSEMEQILSYFNAHHFDYRGLIEKGLALIAPNDMYK